MSILRIASSALAALALLTGPLALADGEPVDSPFNGGDVTQPDDGMGSGSDSDSGCDNNNGGGGIDNPSFPGGGDDGAIDDPSFPGGNDNGGI
jgi:hypothetical protein